ncbi:MAG: ribonuclease III [Actinomycetota bacterium]
MPAAIGYRFANPELLSLALAHRSWCAENGQAQSNERLEFLGDAVLGLAVADELYVQHPDLPEGELAKLRAGVVNASTLAKIARSIELGPVLLLGKGERGTGGDDKQSILADALEAVLGAVYLDGGYDAAQAVVLRLWRDAIAAAVVDGPGGFDHKTRLQEMAVAHFDQPPRYEVDAAGPDHARTFTARVVVGDATLGSGSGSSKKEAEQAAAGEAVAQLERTKGGADDSPAESERRAS